MSFGAVVIARSSWCDLDAHDPPAVLAARSDRGRAAGPTPLVGVCRRPSWIRERRGLLLPGAVQTTTLHAAFFLISLSTILIPAVMVARMGAECARRSAEERLFVQAWHLRQLLPAATRDALSERRSTA